MRRVAITGLGGITAIGNSPMAIFQAAVDARSGVRLAPEFAVGSTVPLVASANFDADTVHLKRRSAPMDRATAMGVAAARQAVENAGPGLFNECGDTGVYWGTAMGAAGTLEDTYRAIFQANDWRVKPTTVVTGMNNAPAALMSMEFGVTGPVLTYSVACASSTIAVGEAMRAIRSGVIDCAIVGGSEAMLTKGMLTAWSALRTLAQCDAHDPTRSCKPFAADRSGFVLGEGAAALVLESVDRAVKRGAHIYAELAGFGLTSDATHIADPSSEGQSRAMSAALLDAKVAPADVGYINAHGTATVVGDRVEVESIKRIFGAIAARVPVSSTKAVHGHVMGATGAIEFMIAVLVLDSGYLPPTAHLLQPDSAFDLDFIPNFARKGSSPSVVMCNSFAFGGSNAVLIARKYDTDPQRLHN